MTTKRGRGRPPIADHDKRRPISAWVAPETEERLHDLAEKLDLSNGQVIDRAIAAYKPKG